MIDYDPDDYGVSYRFAENNSISDEEQIKLYPNPANDKITIEFENVTLDNVELNLSIYTITGRLVMQKTAYTSDMFHQFDVHELKDGMYFYNLQINQKSVQKGKLIIIKK